MEDDYRVHGGDDDDDGDGDDDDDDDDDDDFVHWGNGAVDDFI